MRVCVKAIVMGVSSVYILAVGYWLLAVGNNHARVCQKIVMGVSSVYYWHSNLNYAHGKAVDYCLNQPLILVHKIENLHIGFGLRGIRTPMSEWQMMIVEGWDFCIPH